MIGSQLSVSCGYKVYLQDTEGTGDLKGSLFYLGKAFIFVSSAEVLEKNLAD